MITYCLSQINTVYTVTSPLWSSFSILSLMVEFFNPLPYGRVFQSSPLWSSFSILSLRWEEICNPLLVFFFTTNGRAFGKTLSPMVELFNPLHNFSDEIGSRLRSQTGNQRMAIVFEVHISCLQIIPYVATQHKIFFPSSFFPESSLS